MKGYMRWLIERLGSAWTSFSGFTQQHQQEIALVSAIMLVVLACFFFRKRIASGLKNIVNWFRLERSEYRQFRLEKIGMKGTSHAESIRARAELLNSKTADKESKARIKAEKRRDKAENKLKGKALKLDLRIKRKREADERKERLRPLKLARREKRREKKKEFWRKIKANPKRAWIIVLLLISAGLEITGCMRDNGWMKYSGIAVAALACIIAWAKPVVSLFKNRWPAIKAWGKKINLNIIIVPVALAATIFAEIRGWDYVWTFTLWLCVASVLWLFFAKLKWYKLRRVVISLYSLMYLGIWLIALLTRQ